jgi:CheY-like chemotaxis protein
MPEMDGLGLAIEIRKYRTPQALPLIMLTSVAHRPRDLKVSEVQFSAYLNKPIKPNALFDVLLHAMQIVPLDKPAHRPVALDCKLAETLPLKILVAEDNTVNQKVVQQLLAHLGYRADVVANGIEVLDALERQNYDVILMDVQMPEMDGLEATRRLRARFGATGSPRVIAMTANAMPGDREKCLAAGMDSYVSKPVELDDIRAVLTEMAGHSELDAKNPTLVSDIIQLFFDDSPGHLENIQRAVNEQNAALLDASAHRFLSSIENLGAQRMRTSCMELEALGRSGTVKGADGPLERLKREFDIARQHLLNVNTHVPGVSPGHQTGKNN